MMYHSSQKMPPICFPLPKASREFEKKRKRVVRMTNMVTEEEDGEHANEDEASLILRI